MRARAASARAIAWRKGAGAGSSVLSFGDDETRAIVAYVEALQTGLDRGGHPMARSGRMDETLAAWGVGVLAMLVVARTIARRR